MHDGSFMQLCQCRHVLYSMDAARMHRVHRLSVLLCLLEVDHLQHTDTFLNLYISVSADNNKSIQLIRINYDPMCHHITESEIIQKQGIHAPFTADRQTEQQRRAGDLNLNFQCAE